MNKVNVLKAATVVAAFFVCGVFFLKSQLVLYLVQKQFNNQVVAKKKIQIQIKDSDSFQLDILNQDETLFLKGNLRIIWDVSARSVGFIGELFFKEKRIPTKIWLNSKREAQLTFEEPELKVVVNLDSSPVRQLSGHASRKTENNLSTLNFHFINEMKIWKGSAKAQMQDEKLGDFDFEGEFNLDPDSNKFNAKTQMVPTSVISKKKFPFLQIVVVIPEQEIDESVDFEGSFDLDAGLLVDEPGGDPKTLLKGNLSGSVAPAPELSLNVAGKLRDELESLMISFQFHRDLGKSNFKARLESHLQKNSLVASMVTKRFPAVKVQGGKINADVTNFSLKIHLDETEAFLGETILREIKGQFGANLEQKIFKVKGFQMQFAGGIIKVLPLQWKFQGPSKISFLVNHLDLSQLLKNTGGRLGGEGYFDGSGVLEVNSRGLRLESIHLKNTNPGKVRYEDNTQLYFKKKIRYLNEFQGLLAQGQQALVLKALENFHYQSFEIQAERPSSGDLKVNLNFKGKNPDLANGQLFDISLPVEGNVESLLMGSLLQTPINDEVNKRRK